MMYLTGEQAIH
ncbi:hypothetical protein ACQ34_gp34 [Pseudomonas phage YH6]|nr:hypothetical protein ACQ34_gp34 [Pseudomonas phage YH6]AIX13187.1 hypothetical protein YH6_034 [Pseudomonas phage YH6]